VPVIGFEIESALGFREHSSEHWAACLALEARTAWPLDVYWTHASDCFSWLYYSSNDNKMSYFYIDYFGFLFILDLILDN